MASLLVLLCFVGVLEAQYISGVLRDDVTRQPVSGATVQVFGTSSAAISDSIGAFVLEGLAPGRYRIAIRHIQYDPASIDVQLGSSKDLVLNMELTARSEPLPEATVEAVAPLSRDVLYQITEEETRLYPGTFFDPGRVAASFPGTQIANDQANQLIIYGMHPDLMKWQIEGLEVINPNHLSNAGALADRPTLTGGGVNMLSNQMLTNSVLHAGAMSIEKGNAISGVMDMHLRSGNSAKLEHTIQAGLLGIDVATEGPFKQGGRATYLVNARYSTVGLLSQLGVDFGDETIQFYDVSANFRIPAAKTGGDIRIFLLYGANSNDLSPKPEDEWTENRDRSDVHFESDAGALGIIWNKPLGSSAFLRTGLAASGRNFMRTESWVDFPEPYAHEELTLNQITFTTHLQVRTGQQSQLSAGLNLHRQGHYSEFLTDVHSAFRQYRYGSDVTTYLVRPYLDWSWQVAGLSFELGVGYPYFHAGDSDFGHLEPIARVNVPLGGTGTVSLGYRRSFQVPLQYHSTYRYETGETLNTSLDLTEGHLVEATYRTKIANGALQLAVFRSFLSNALVGPTGFAMVNLHGLPPNAQLSEDGDAEALGVTAGYRKGFYHGYFLSANLSIFQSKYTDYASTRRSTTFDMGHAAYVAGGKEWTVQKDYGKRTFGANLAIIHNGGMREPIIDEAASVEADRTIYDPDTYGEIQLDDYFRVDVRLYLRKDKVSKSTTWSLDIQNLTNRENQWLSTYDFLTQSVRPGTQLGLIPVLSYRVDF